MMSRLVFALVFFFNDTATTEIYTLSLHDALPICRLEQRLRPAYLARRASVFPYTSAQQIFEEHRETTRRSEEHTSELQSRSDLVCRLLLEKKKARRQNSLHL